MYQRAFATVADESVFPGLWALLNSVYAYHGTTLRAFAFLHGPSDESMRRRLSEHPLGPALTTVPTREMCRPPADARAAGPQVVEHLTGRARVVCLLGADLLLLSSMDDMFSEAGGGRIIASGSAAGEPPFGEEYAAFGPRIVGTRFPRASSGFLCLKSTSGRNWNGCRPAAPRRGLLGERVVAVRDREHVAVPFRRDRRR